MSGLTRKFDGKEYDYQYSANTEPELAALKKELKQYFTNVRVLRGSPYDAKYNVYARGSQAEYRPMVQAKSKGKKWRTIQGSPTFTSLAAVKHYIKKREKADKKARVRRNYGWRSKGVKLETRRG